MLLLPIPNEVRQPMLNSKQSEVSSLNWEGGHAQRKMLFPTQWSELIQVCYCLER